MQQVATAPDGVPVFQDQGKYFTQNGDGTYTQQFQGGAPAWLTQASGGGGGDLTSTIQNGIRQAYGRDATPSDIQYWTGKWGELQARGQEIGDPNYAMNRLLGKDAKGSDAPSGGPFAGQGGGSGSGAGDWWTGQGVSPAELASYGVPGSPYASQAFGGRYDVPAPTGVLAQQFKAPTLAELQATPGYQARLDAQNRTLDRSAAAKGSILSGGFINREAQAAQDYASNEYNNLFGQSLAGRSQNQGEFQQNVVQPGQFQYQNQYKQYLDEQNRTLNDYLTNYNINRTGIQDFLTQNNTTANRGLQATIAGAPR
jgi:hypothetical protein